MRLCVHLVFVSAAVAATGFAQVEIPPGFEIVDVHVSNNFTDAPSLNNCGQIAHGKRLGGSWSQAEVFLYENGRISQITVNGDRDVFPQINDDGTMTWMRGLGDTGVHQVILFIDGDETVLADEPRPSGLTSGVAMNNLGHVVWAKDRSRCPLRSEIYLYDGFTTRMIEKSRWKNQTPDINDAGWITWMHSDFCDSDPWAGTIQLYRDGRIIDLPSSGTQPVEPHINNHGQIVWPADTDLELWEDGETRILRENHVAVPNIGDSGDIYMAHGEIDRGTWNASLCRFEDGTPRFYRLSDDTLSVSRGSVNGWGEVAWVYYTDPPRGDWSGGIRLMRRVRTGDAEFDGDIDQDDYSRFAEGMNGPVRMDGLCERRFLDIDHDGDLDLADFARLQNAFGQ